jgi:hypothetical protein
MVILLCMTSFHNQASQETRNLWSGSSLNLNHANKTSTIIKQLDVPVVVTWLHRCIHLLHLPGAATLDLALIQVLEVSLVWTYEFNRKYVLPNTFWETFLLK